MLLKIKYYKIKTLCVRWYVADVLRWYVADVYADMSLMLRWYVAEKCTLICRWCLRWYVADVYADMSLMCTLICRCMYADMSLMCTLICRWEVYADMSLRSVRWYVAEIVSLVADVYAEMSLLCTLICRWCVLLCTPYHNFEGKKFLNSWWFQSSGYGSWSIYNRFPTSGF